MMEKENVTMRGHWRAQHHQRRGLQRRMLQNFEKMCCAMSSHRLSSLPMARQKKAIYRATTQRFGEWLRSLREGQELPLRVVAAAAAMDQAHLSKVELGQRLLTGEQAAAIAKFFKVNATEFEARRIVEKFRLEHADNPAAAQAIHMLNEDPTAYKSKK